MYKWGEGKEKGGRREGGGKITVIWMASFMTNPFVIFTVSDTGNEISL